MIIFHKGFASCMKYVIVSCFSVLHQSRVCVLSGAGELPVELVDVLYVAEQSADLLRFQRQCAAVDDAAEIILQTERGSENYPFIFCVGGTLMHAGQT